MDGIFAKVPGAGGKRSGGRFRQQRYPEGDDGVRRAVFGEKKEIPGVAFLFPRLSPFFYSTANMGGA